MHYRKSVKNSCSCSCTDASTDHNKIMMKFALRLQKVHGAKKVQKWDEEKLNQGNNR